MYHYRVAYGKNKIEGITATAVGDAFAKTGNRADAAKLLGVKYKTLCSWLTSKASFERAMQKGMVEYKENQQKCQNQDIETRNITKSPCSVS